MTIDLPEKDEVVRILEVFLQKDPQLALGEAFDLCSAPPGTYYTLLADESGEVQGAMATDLPATVYLGGSLVMIPENSMQEQVRTAEPNEAVIDGISEAFNAIRGALNRVADNPHVDYTPVAELTSPGDSDSTAWLCEPSARMDLVGNFPVGEGHLVLLAR